MSSEQRDDVLPLTWAVGNEYEANWRSIWIHFKSNQIRIEETPEGILHITTRKKDVTKQSGEQVSINPPTIDNQAEPPFIVSG